MKNYRIISHGEWCDPEIEYKGYLFNYWDVEKILFDDFNDDIMSNWIPKNYDFDKYYTEHIENVLYDLFGNLGSLSITDLYEKAPSWFDQVADGLYYSDDWDNPDYPTDHEVIDAFQGVCFSTGDFEIYGR